MIRKPRNKRYTIKAYYIENETQTVFYCKENKMRNITNEMGASMPLSNGERLLETDSTLDFEINQSISIGNDIVLIQDFNANIDDKDLNSMRGKPSYITTLLVR